MKWMWSGGQHVARSPRLKQRFGLVIAVSLAATLLIVVWMAAGAEGTPSAATPSPGAGTAVASPAASPGASGHVTIHIKDFFFDPAKVTIKVGTTVTWINDGPTAHTTVSFQGGKTIWDSNILTKGQSYSYTFKKPGTYPYICGLHPNMKAVIVVEP